MLDYIIFVITVIVISFFYLIILNIIGTLLKLRHRPAIETQTYLKELVLKTVKIILTTASLVKTICLIVYYSFKRRKKYMYDYIRNVANIRKNYYDNFKKLNLTYIKLTFLLASNSGLYFLQQKIVKSLNAVSLNKILFKFYSFNSFISTKFFFYKLLQILSKNFSILPVLELLKLFCKNIYC